MGRTILGLGHKHSEVTIAGLSQTFRPLLTPFRSLALPVWQIFVKFTSNYQVAEAEVKHERELAETRRKNRELQAKLKNTAVQRERRNSLEAQTKRG